MFNPEKIIKNIIGDGISKSKFDWKYQICPNCKKKQLIDEGNRWYCQNCGESFTPDERDGKYDVEILNHPPYR